MPKSKRTDDKTVGRFVVSNASKSAVSNLPDSKRDNTTGRDVVKSVGRAAPSCNSGERIAVKSRNSTKKFNSAIYGQLLIETIPKVIESQDEYDRIEAKFERLLDKGDERSAEEDMLFDLLASLLQDYEKRTLPRLEATSPISTLRFLMEQNNLHQTDLVEYFGSQGNVSQVLAGKRAISKGAAQKLSARFKVSTDIFLKDM
jgi:antitoxin component HigA of HigAB toxin-antitoxin module